MKKKLTISGFFAFVMLMMSDMSVLAQQRVQFTQYMFNNVVINPAYAGADEALSLTFIHRSQWAGVENAPTTQTLSGHTLFKHKHMGLGGTIIRDEVGVHKSLNALINYAYHLRMSEVSFFSMGLYAGILNRKSDYSTLTGSALNDPHLANPYISYTALDFGVGFYFRSPKFHAGISAPGLIPERVRISDTLTINPSKTNIFFFTKLKLPLNENVDLEPSTLIKYLEGVPVSFDLNLNLIYRNVLTGGVSYRKNESIDFLLKAQVTPQLQFGYSYDYPIGPISLLSNGSHELMVQYLFKYVEKNVQSPR
jgi:type IX secretion system PorP/SprF family membrane protein